MKRNLDYYKKKKSRKKGVIIIVVILIIVLIITISSYLYVWVMQKAQTHVSYSVLHGETINETSDYWNITINEVDEHFHDDIRYFEFHIWFVKDEELLFEERRSFDELKINNSKYIEFIDNDNDDRITSNDVISIKKYYNDTKENIIMISIWYWDDDIQRGQKFLSLDEMDIGRYPE